jgi:UDP-N-acetylglucosamine--N-acetylmuramyl-(pentapeptide) pyrophosphoryl-undecaprenol N-acetylglucosamine transferase
MNVADAIRRLEPDAVITAIGTERGLDTTLIPARGHRLELIPPAPLPRRWGRDLLRTPRRLQSATCAAVAILDRANADVVLGFGSYVALPVYLAARWRRTPLLVYEVNTHAGLANRVGARLTRHVFTASDQIRLPHARAVGVPLRPEISNLDRTALRATAHDHFRLDRDIPTLLITGGSQGAQSINAAVAAAPADICAAGIQVVHVVGPKNVAAAEAADTDAHYRVVPFVERMTLAYAAADLVVCRAGAMTCAELSAVGLPAVYVPLPLRGGEQRRNAEPIIAAGGGVLIEDAALTGHGVRDTVLSLLTDPARLQAMSQAARRSSRRDADVILAREALHLAASRHAVPASVAR